MTKLNPNHFLDDDFEVYADPGQRRHRLSNHRPSLRLKRSRAEVLAAALPREDSFHPDLHLASGNTVTGQEGDWILSHLGPFYATHKITDVLRRVKGGKEANVYCCAAHPATGLELIAAKLYRPRLWRNLKNDARYREGRPILNRHGQAVGQRDWRLHKAIQQKSNFGKEAQQTSWLEYEFQTMQRLYDAGADVPQPLVHGSHTILMEYLGDATVPAPTLDHVVLAPDEARPLFDRLMRNVELMLTCYVVHGDLSAYNVMYWDGEVKIIDFPQVVDPRQNPDASTIFQRDVTRLCQYFGRYGVRSDSAKLAHDLWQQHAVESRGT